MKLLSFVLLSAGSVLADNLVPLSIMRPTCIRQGKCVNEQGLRDPTVCCSGVCDAKSGCVLTGEANSILTRATLAGAPFICKSDSYHGVRGWQPSHYHSGKSPSECLCPDDMPCLIGNGDTPLSSNRFWVGKCDPTDNVCVPKLELGVEVDKTLFCRDGAGLDNGMGGACADGNDATCVEDGATCRAQGSCTVTHATPVLTTTCPTNGFDDFVDTLVRDLGDDGNVCARQDVPLNGECLCNQDCADFNANDDLTPRCIIQAANNLAGIDGQMLADDLSVTGKCLIQPGMPTTMICTEDCHCTAGSTCFASTFGDPGLCTIPAGSGESCTANTQCTGAATCLNSLCKLPTLEDCEVDGQCHSGHCAADGKCRVELTGTCTSTAECDQTDGPVACIETDPSGTSTPQCRGLLGATCGGVGDCASGVCTSDQCTLQTSTGNGLCQIVGGAGGFYTAGVCGGSLACDTTGATAIGTCQ